MAALETLERGDFAKMPGGIFSRSFVRAYALEIGLDPDPVVEEFVAEVRKLEQEAAARRAVRPEVTADDREFLARQRRALRILRLSALGVITIVLVTLAVQVPRWLGRNEAANAAGASATTTAPQPAGESGAGAFAPPPVTSAAPVPTEPRLSVLIETTGDCWIQAVADGKVVVSRLFKAGDRESLKAEKELLLDVGNAGMVQWTINGKRGKAIGRPGVNTRVRVTPDNVAEFVQTSEETGTSR